MVRFEMEAVLAGGSVNIAVMRHSKTTFIRNPQPTKEQMWA